MIKSYKITDSNVQASGIQRVRVAFTDHLGRVHNRGYDFHAKAVIADEIAIRQPNVENGLKEQEIQSAITAIESGKPFPVLNYATAEEVKLSMTDRIVEKQSEIDGLTTEKTLLDSEVK